MLVALALTIVSIVRPCSGVAELLPYKNGVATDLTAQFLSATAPQATRSVVRNLGSAFPIHFYGQDVAKITIFESGVVQLNPAVPLSACPSTLNAQSELNYAYISVYWRRALVDFLGRGRIYFQEKAYDSSTDIKIVSDIQTAFSTDIIKEDGFHPTYLHIVTWDSMGSFDEGQRTLRNTFQLVIASDNVKSFGIFLFSDVQYYAEQDQRNNLCTRPAKVGIRSNRLTYWISNEVERLEQAKRINVFSNIKLYDKNFLGRYCLRFFGVRTTTNPNVPILFPRPAPALHQNCVPPFNVHPVCLSNVPDDYCIGKTGEQRHPNLCTKYVYCDWDQVRGIASCPGPGSNWECPEGMSWNAHLRFCSCDNSQNCKTTAFSEVSMLVAGSTQSPEFRTPNLQIDLDCEYYPDGNYINFDECDSFWQCSNKRNMKMSCPAGLMWNANHKNGGWVGYCDWPAKVDCSRREFLQLEPKTTPRP